MSSRKETYGMLVWLRPVRYPLWLLIAVAATALAILSPALLHTSSRSYAFTYLGLGLASFAAFKTSEWTASEFHLPDGLGTQAALAVYGFLMIFCGIFLMFAVIAMFMAFGGYLLGTDPTEGIQLCAGFLSIMAFYSLGIETFSMFWRRRPPTSCGA